MTEVIFLSIQDIVEIWKQITILMLY